MEEEGMGRRGVTINVFHSIFVSIDLAKKAFGDEFLVDLSTQARPQLHLCPQRCNPTRIFPLSSSFPHASEAWIRPTADY